LRYPVIINDNTSKIIEPWIKKLQRILGGLIEIDINVNEGKIFIFGFREPRRNPSFIKFYKQKFFDADRKTHV
jgi:hypothetical protein